MTKQYPRLPTGPSAVGTAGVRALQSTGGDWQYKQKDIGTKSYHQGEFTKVIVEGDPLYVAAGQTAPTKVSVREVNRVQVPAMPSVWGAFGVSMDDGDFARWVRSAPTDEYEEFFYTPDYKFKTSRRTTGLSLVLNGIKKKAIAVAVTEANQEFYGPIIPATFVEPDIAYLGAGKVFTVIPQFVGRVDGSGRPLLDLLLVVASRKDGAVARVLPLPSGAFGAPSEVFPRVIPFVTQDAAFALVIQKQLTAPAIGPDFLGPDSYKTKAWLYSFHGHGMTINAMTDITGPGLVSDFYVSTTEHPTGILTYEYIPEWSYEAVVYAGPFLTAQMMDAIFAGAGRMLDGMLTLVLPNNVTLVFCETMHAGKFRSVDGLTSFDYRKQSLRRLNVTRISYSGGIVSAAHVYQSRYALVVLETATLVFAGLLAEYPEGVDNGTGLPRVQSAVYLGNGVVLAKRSTGHAAMFGSAHLNSFDYDDHPEWMEQTLASTGHDISFIRSTDSGETWTEIAPIGFDNAGENQYFGDLVTHEAATAEDMGTVLISAWDNTKAAYYVYESKDQGSSWTRRGNLAKPDTFRRMDSWRPGDGGAHFGELRPVGTKTRPVDVSIPTRYKRD